MRVIRKIGVMSLLFVAILCVQSADAGSGQYLPESSYASGLWQGYRYYDEGLLSGRIDFAVYDSDNLGPGSLEETFVEGLGVLGQYIYAYQIFNDIPLSEEAVAYFAVFAVDPGPIDAYSIDSYLDPGFGVEDDDAYFTESKGVWEFDETLIYASEHSWYLVFGSDYSPVPGDYEILGASQEGQFPFGEKVPEPAMLTLFGLGSVLMVHSRRRRSV